MRQIGDPLKFAVRYELDANYGGVWMYGKFCYVFNGQEVGDYEAGTSLRDVLFQLDELMKFDRQPNSRFQSVSAKDLFENIDVALSGSGPDVLQELANEEHWRSLCAFPPVDVFDGWKGFLINDGKFCRFIFSHSPYAEIREVAVDFGEFDLIINSVRKELNDIYELELI